MNPRQISTPDGPITVTPSGAHTEFTYTYDLADAPLLRTNSPGRPNWFQPVAAEVLVQDGETVEVTLIGPRISASGRRTAVTLQRALTYYQRYQTPWDNLPEWAEPLVTLHDSILPDHPPMVAMSDVYSRDPS